ncbi:MAG: glucosamine-6-phosphate deaminase [Sphaerochaetaceae bacterium]
MKIVIRKTVEEVDAYVSLVMASRILDAPSLVMALATGNTTKSLYGRFQELAKSSGLATGAAYGIAVDEYLGIDPTDSISCGFRLHAAFVETGLLEQSHLITPHDVQGVCEVYEQRISDLGGIDLQILGVGANGHLGFNEPQSSFSSTTHVVSLTKETRETLAKKYKKQSVDQIPEKGITIGLGTIMRSKEIVVILKGREKASIAADLIAGSLSEAVPASILQIHPNCTVVLDAEAAGLLHAT